MTIDIVELNATTRELLNNVDDDVFDNPIIAEQADAFIRDKRHLMFLALDGGRVIGMASAIEYLHPDKPLQFFINEVGVAKPYRCQGIARQLVRRLIDSARERGCESAWLGTEPDNTAAVACYAGIPGGDTPEPFVLFEWPLQEPKS